MAHWSRYVFRLGLVGLVSAWLLALWLAISGQDIKTLEEVANGAVVKLGAGGGMLFMACGFVLLAFDISGLRRTWNQLDNATRWLATFALVIGHFGTAYLVYFLMRKRFFADEPQLSAQ